jgi:predicted DsbA family dithiol-disulfide isomerase
MKIEIWSDVVCPFCYLGKRKLEKAMKAVGLNENVEIIWRSFQLDPDFPEQKAIPSSRYLAERKGYPMEQINQIQKHLADRSLQYGIDFQFDKSLSFNTLKAHQLLHWSQQFGVSDSLKEVFFKAYFTDGLDLSDEDVLTELVTKVGLKAEDAKKIIASQHYFDEIESDFYQARQLGVRGVPFFLINNRTSISGAQEDSIFEHILQTEITKSRF